MQLVERLELLLNELINIASQSLQRLFVGAGCLLQLLNWLGLFEDSLDELFETHCLELVMLVLVLVHSFAFLVLAVEAEEGVVAAVLVEAHHLCLIFVRAGWE